MEQSFLPLDVLYLVIDQILDSCHSAQERRTHQRQLLLVSRSFCRHVSAELLITSFDRLKHLSEQPAEFWNPGPLKRPHTRATVAIYLTDWKTEEEDSGVVRVAACKIRPYLADLKDLSLLGKISNVSIAELWDPSMSLTKLQVGGTVCCRQDSWRARPVPLGKWLNAGRSQLRSIEVHDSTTVNLFEGGEDEEDYGVAFTGEPLENLEVLLLPRLSFGWSYTIDHKPPKSQLRAFATFQHFLSLTPQTLRVLRLGNNPFTIEQFVDIFRQFEDGQLEHVELTDLPSRHDSENAKNGATAAKFTELWHIFGSMPRLRRLTVENCYLEEGMFDFMELLPKERHLPFWRGYPALEVLTVTCHMHRQWKLRPLLTHIFNRLQSGDYGEIRPMVRILGYAIDSGPDVAFNQQKAGTLRKRYGVRIGLEPELIEKCPLKLDTGGW
ncbi:hypothetical protein T439DRAFT_379200 [Meredithblackwellia eburnea MCA 4105]